MAKISTSVLFKVNNLKEIEIGSSYYAVGRRFVKNRYPGVGSQPGTYSYALLAYKYMKEGNLNVKWNGKEGLVSFPQHVVLVAKDINNNYCMSFVDRTLSETSESTVIAALAAEELGLWGDPNLTPEYFCDAVYFKFLKLHEISDEPISQTEMNTLLGNVNAASKVAAEAEDTKKVADPLQTWFEKAKAGEYIIPYNWPNASMGSIVPLVFLEGVKPTKELMRLAKLVEYNVNKALERMNNDLDITSEYVLNIQIPGDVGSGKTLAVNALSAIFGMPLWSTTAEPDQGVEIVEGETKMVGSELTFVNSPLGEWCRNGGIGFVDEFIEGETDRMFSSFAQLLEYPYHIFENGFQEVKRHPLAVCIVAYNNGIEGGSTIAQPLMSRFNHVVKFETQGEELFIDLLKSWNADEEYPGYDRDELCRWVYDAYKRTVNSLENKRPDIVAALSLRTCRAILTEIMCGVEPTEALSCLWGIVEHYDATEAQTLKNGALSTLRDI